MTKQESVYKNNTVTKPSKKILPYLLDYLLNLILTMVLYIFINLIASSMPLFKNIQTNASNVQTQLYEIVNSSGLTYQGDDGYLISTDTRIEQLIKEEMIYVFELNDDSSKLSSATYSGYQALNLEDRTHTNPIYYYYTNYKANNLDLYLDDSKNTYGYEYYINTIVDLNEYSDYFELDVYEEDTLYPIIKYEIAEDIHQYLLDGIYLYGETAYNTIYNLYFYALNDAMDDLINNNSSYVSLNEEYYDYVYDMLNIRGNCLLISYFLSTSIIYLLMPILLKEGRTIGLRAFRLITHDIKGNKINIINNLIRYGISIFSSFSLLIISLFFIFTTEGMYFFSINLLGFINIFILGIVSFIFSLISYTFTIIMKSTNQNIEELLSMMVVVNLDEMKIDIEKKEEENKLDEVKEINEINEEEKVEEHEE